MLDIMNGFKALTEYYDLMRKIYKICNITGKSCPVIPYPSMGYCSDGIVFMKVKLKAAVVMECLWKNPDIANLEFGDNYPTETNSSPILIICSSKCCEGNLMLPGLCIL